MEPNPEESSGMTRGQRWLLLTALFLPLIVYLRTLQFDFVYDDKFLVVNNPSVQRPVSLLHLFREGMWAFAGQGTLPYYRPLLMLFFAAEHWLFGNNPLLWHLVNLLLHVAAVGLVYWAGNLLLREHNAGLIAALLFGVFPIGSEVASWVAAGNESLLAIFMLLSFGAFLKSESSRVPVAWLAFSWAMLLAGMLVKELAIALPALIFYYSMRMPERGGRERWWPAVRNTIPYVLVVIGVLLLRARVVGPALVNGSLAARFANVGALARFMFSKLLWPSGLSIFYPAVRPSVWSSVLAVILVGMAFLAAWRSVRLSFLLLWVVLFAAPAVNVVNPNFALQTRYLYLSAVAFCWCLGWLLSRLLSSPMTARTAVIGLTGIYGFVSFTAAGAWANDLTLFAQAAKAAPQSASALFSYSSALQEHNRTEEALAVVTRAHQLEPQVWLYLFQISKYELMLHHLPEAEAAIDEAGAPSVPKTAGQSDSTMKFKARILLTEGRLKEAESMIRSGLVDHPDDEELRQDLASCMTRQKTAAEQK